MIKEILYQHEAQVYQLICELEQDTFDKKSFQKKWAQNIENEDCLMFGYFNQDKLVGFISVYIKEYLHHHHKTGEIAELVVDRNYRNQKIGKQLIQFVINIAKDLQLEELELCTNIRRKDAHRFYESMGFIMDHYNFVMKL